MKFAVGYPVACEPAESFVDLVRDYREHVAEVYLAWVGAPSGRAAAGQQHGYVDWSAQQRIEQDLLALRQMGIKLDILFNANCYGRHAVGRYLEGMVSSILEHLEGLGIGADIVTTSSLAVAHVVKKHFPRIEVRASVNMRIGTIEAMRYVSHLFDSYCIQRDVQRSVAYAGELKSWCDAHGKGLSMLANSGCLRCCPGQSFHDNMVAHEIEIDETANIPGWTPHVCWNLYRNRANWPALLQSTWVRPEDLGHYDDLFPVVKLATRMHAWPRLVLHAYSQRCHAGNLLDLLEPGFGPMFAPHIIDNTSFPADWFERTSTCDRRCQRCSYCAGVLQDVLRSPAVPTENGSRCALDEGRRYAET
jgi:collagenase-like PrtC family protease